MSDADTDDLPRRPSTGADAALAFCLLVAILALSTGVIEENAPGDVVGWKHVVSPLAAALAGAGLLLLRRAYPDLPRLCRFLTHAGAVAIAGAIVLGAMAASR